VLSSNSGAVDLSPFE
jgi:hypothetical protein